MLFLISILSSKPDKQDATVKVPEGSGFLPKTPDQQNLFVNIQFSRFFNLQYALLFDRLYLQMSGDEIRVANVRFRWCYSVLCKHVTANCWLLSSIGAIVVSWSPAIVPCFPAIVVFVFSDIAYSLLAPIDENILRCRAVVIVYFISSSMSRLKANGRIDRLHDSISLVGLKPLGLGGSFHSPTNKQSDTSFSCEKAKGPLWPGR